MRRTLDLGHSTKSHTQKNKNKRRKEEEEEEHASNAVCTRPSKSSASDSGLEMDEAAPCWHGEQKERRGAGGGLLYDGVVGPLTIAHGVRLNGDESNESWYFF